MYFYIFLYRISKHIYVWENSKCRLKYQVVRSYICYLKVYTWKHYSGLKYEQTQKSLDAFLDASVISCNTKSRQSEGDH